MRREKVAAPPGLASAQSRLRLDDLRVALESRYGYRLPSPDGVVHTVRSGRGKVLVLNFWATWCAPCRGEMPAIGRVRDSTRARGLELFAITDEPPAKVQDFLAKNAAGVPVLCDETRKVFDRFRIIGGLPQTVVLDRKGKLVEHFAAQVNEEHLRTAVLKAAGLR
jgi:peroxiredoxin